MLKGFNELDTTVTLDERYISTSKNSLLFFHSESEVSLPLEDYERIWPYTSNIWTTTAKGYKSKKTSIEKTNYKCRCNNNKKNPKHANQENRDSNKKRRMTKVKS